MWDESCLYRSDNKIPDRLRGEKGQHDSGVHQRLEGLQEKVMPFLGNRDNPMAQACVLFDWLWVEKPGRYKFRGSYRLSEVLDAQMSTEASAVGNCLGLTLLYNCLLRKIGIQARALFLEYAFNKAPMCLPFFQRKKEKLKSRIFYQRDSISEVIS